MKRDRKKGEGILTLRLAGAGDDGDVVVHYVVIPGATLITRPRVGGWLSWSIFSKNGLGSPLAPTLRPPSIPYAEILFVTSGRKMACLTCIWKRMGVQCSRPQCPLLARREWNRLPGRWYVRSRSSHASKANPPPHAKWTELGKAWQGQNNM